MHAKLPCSPQNLNLNNGSSKDTIVFFPLKILTPLRAYQKIGAQTRPDWIAGQVKDIMLSFLFYHHKYISFSIKNDKK
jgi:hypothetical protein